MGLLLTLTRRVLAVVFFFTLLATCEGAWTDIFQKEFLRPGPEKPKDVCLECHTSNLMKPEYRAIPAEWQESWHYKNGVSCHDCHGGDFRDATKAMLSASGFVGVPKPKDVPEFCGKCHIGVKENYLESGHGKALKATGRGPNCLLCHGSHGIQKASIEIINEKLCGVCHSYDRAKTIKTSLLLTEKQMNKIDGDLKRLRAGLISTEADEKVLFRTQADFRALFHTVDVNLVNDRTAEFTKRLDALGASIQKGFQELRFRQDFSLFIMCLFIALGIGIFLLGRRSG